jgi:23S rRNA (adenine2503-C2)-methyltransferase
VSRPDLRSLSAPALQELVAALGEKPFRARQLYRWLHRRGAATIEAMTDLPQPFRAALAERAELPTLAIDAVQESTDGTIKYRLRTADGKLLEAVFMPEESRRTLCVSTQVGCAMGCVFCASGVAGLTRNMGADEMVAQVLLGRSQLASGEVLRGVVLMGMGEPLHNYEATARALRLLTHPDGIGLSSRRVTVSTSGLVPEIDRLGADFQGQIGLAVSLHAADEALRSRLMPINRKYPLATLMAALHRYPLPHRRRITIEYTLIADENDSARDAKRLADLLRGLPVKINLIPMNRVEASGLGPPDDTRVLAFQKIVCAAGYSCFIRRRRGSDVAAACGQLALLGGRRKVKTALSPSSAR